MDELQQLRQEIKRATASSSIENLKLIQKLYTSVVQEFKDSDLEMQAQLVALKSEIDHFPTLLKALKTGPKGEKGTPGERGERGVGGKDGRAGRDGRDGQDGRDGLDGQDGADGKDASVEDLIETINDSDGTIDKERIEGLKELEEKADLALSRPMGNPFGGGASGVKDIIGGINTTVTENNGKYTINAMGGGNYKAKTADYTIEKEDELINCTANTFTVSLPALSTIADGRSYIIKNSGTGVITLDPYLIEEIDGDLLVTILSGDSLTIVATATDWIVI